jgi:hypothetical protein
LVNPNLLDPAPFEVFEQVVLGLFIFPVSDLKSEHLSFSALSNAHDCQNERYTALIIVDGREIGSIGKRIHVAWSRAGVASTAHTRPLRYGRHAKSSRQSVYTASLR